MNIGAFGENFPYSNFHDLNMDWIIKIAKDFLDQYTHIQETIDTGLTELDEKAEALQTLLQEWYNTHSEDIADQLASALADLNAWYTTHQNYLDKTLAQNILAFDTHANTKAQETIASIPADYTTLSEEVKSLKGTVGEENTTGVQDVVTTNPNPLAFERAVLNGDTGVTTPATYRITNRDLQYCLSDIHITVAPGFRHYVGKYSSDGTYQAGTGWINENSYYTIEKGTYYKLQIARMSGSESTSELADFTEFTKGCIMTYRLHDMVKAYMNSLHLIDVNSFVYKVSANTAGGTQTIFKNVQLPAGQYFIQCQQDVTLQSAGRNMFFYTNTGTNETVYENPVSHLPGGTHTWYIDLPAGTYSFFMLTNNPSANVVNSDFVLGNALNNTVLTQQTSVLRSNPDDITYDSIYYILNNTYTPEEHGLLITTKNGYYLNQTFISNLCVVYSRRHTGTAWTTWMRQFVYCSYANMGLGDGFGYLTESRHNESNTIKLQQYYDWHNNLLRIRASSDNGNAWRDWSTFRPINYNTNYSGFLPCKKQLWFDTEYNATMGQGIAVYNNFLFAIYNRTDGHGISVYSMTSTKEDGSLTLLLRNPNMEIGHGNAIQFGQILDGEYPHLYISGWNDNKVYEYKYDQTGFTLVRTHSLPSNLVYTTVAVNELEKTFYIFNCDVVPEVMYNYDFIKWNYETQTIISQRKTEPFMTMQDCEFACGVILVAGGYGQTGNPSTCYIYDTDGNRIGSVGLNERLTTTEIEGVSYDRITGELYIGQSYFMYRVRG